MTTPAAKPTDPAKLAYESDLLVTAALLRLGIMAQDVAPAYEQPIVGRAVARAIDASRARRP